MSTMVKTLSFPGSTPIWSPTRGGGLTTLFQLCFLSNSPMSFQLCKDCFFVNPPSENHCMRCFASFIPSSSHPLSISSKDEPNWTCERCTAVNTLKDSVCYACDLRPKSPNKKRKLSSFRWYSNSTDSALESNNPDSSVGHNGVDLQDNSTDLGLESNKRPNKKPRLSSFHRFDNSTDSGLESNNPDSSVRQMHDDSEGFEFDFYSRKPVTVTFVLPHALSKHANQSIDLFMKENEGVHIKIRSNDQAVRLLSITSLEFCGVISTIEKVADNLIGDWCARPDKPYLKRLLIGNYVLTLLLDESQRTCFEDSFSDSLTIMTDTKVSFIHHPHILLSRSQEILQESKRPFFRSSFD